MRNYMLCVFIAVALFSCKTINENMAVSVDEETIGKFRDIAVDFYEYQKTGDTALLETVAGELPFIKKRIAHNTLYEAKLLGVKGELAFYRNALPEVADCINKIEQITLKEEELYLLKALVAFTPDKKEEALKEGIAQASSTERIELMLADLTLQKGGYAEAAALYDDALSRADPRYKSYFSKERDRAFLLATTPFADPSSAGVVMEDLVNITGMLKLVANETTMNVSDYLKRTRIDSAVLRELKYKGYLVNDQDGPLKRKELAYFLYADLKGKNGYLLPEEGNGRERLSPVKDIPSGSIYLAPVLFVAEWGIMDLIDGVHFAPDQPVSGEECYEIIKKADQYAQ